MDSRFTSNNFLLCEYEDASSLWISHSSKNPERLYFRCQDKKVDTKFGFPIDRHQAEQSKRKRCKQKTCTEAESTKRQKLKKNEVSRVF